MLLLVERAGMGEILDLAKTLEAEGGRRGWNLI
jgi:hypothetical protein